MTGDGPLSFYAQGFLLIIVLVTTQRAVLSVKDTERLVPTGIPLSVIPVNLVSPFS